MSGAAVERYAHVYDRSLHNYVMVPQEDGDWVQSEDHDAAIAALTAELQQCREALRVIAADTSAPAATGRARTFADIARAAIKERT